MVHFRNIIGNRQEFAEVAVDEGVVDMARAMKVYRDTGYDGIITPDHADPGPERSRAARSPWRLPTATSTRSSRRPI